MSSKARTLVKGSILRVSEFFASAIVGLMMMPFIIRSLGDNMYGLWVFVGSFLGYYGLMDFGLNSAIQRFISKAIGAGDHQDINKTVNTALVIFSIIGLAALLITGAIAFFLPLYIKNITEVALFRKVLFILGLNFALGFPLRVFSGILTANLRYDISTSIELCKLVIRTILIIIFLKNGYGIMALAVITFLLDIGGYVVKAIFVKILYRHIIFSLTLFDKTRVRNLFGYSVYTFISQIADQLRFNIDNLVIVVFIGLSYVTLYSIGSRLIKYFMEFMGSALGMTLPVFSQYEGSGDYKSIREKYLFLTKISSYLSLMIGGLLIIFGKLFILRWMGPRYLEAYTILLILLVPFLFDIMQSSCGGLLYGLSKHKYYAITNSLEGVANLILSIMLVKYYGIYGVAIGTAIPMLIIKVFIQPIYTCKIAGITYYDFYVKLMTPVILISCSIFFFMWFVIRKVAMPDYFNIISLIVISSSIFILVVYNIGFSRNERKMLKQGVGRA